MKNPLAIAGIKDFAVTPTADSLALKAALIEEISLLPEKVTSDDDKIEFGDMITRCRNLERDVDKCRVEIKKPVLEAGRAIDEAARSFVQQITEARTSVEYRLTQYIADRRKEQELVAQLVAAQEEEIRAEAEKIRAENERKAAQAAAANQPPPKPDPVPEIQKTAVALETVEGARFVQEFDFEVLDAEKVARWNFFFVNVEVRKSDLKGYINLPGTNRDEIPGIRVFEVQRLASRATPKKSDTPPF